MIVLMCFFVYAFLGWCCEVCYAALIHGKFVNRGFLNGPLCPIYGFGVIAVVFLLDPVKDNFVELFLGSVLITSFIELTAGFTLEQLFHQKWWDYSDKPLNIGGYICPLFSLMWGIACMVVVDRIHPFVLGVINLIPDLIAMILLGVFIALFLVDMIETVKTILKLNRKLERIDELSAMIKKTSNEIGENLATKTIELVSLKGELEDKMEQKKKLYTEEMAVQIETKKESIEQLEQRLHNMKQSVGELLDASPAGIKRILKAFPNLSSTEYTEALEKLKAYKLNKTEHNQAENMK
jgi:uncharacterized membrane protein